MSTSGPRDPTAKLVRFPGSERGIAVAVLVAMVGGVVSAVDVFAPLPAPVVALGGVLFCGALVALGVLTFRYARRHDVTVGAAVAHGLQVTGKALLLLLP